MNFIGFFFGISFIGFIINAILDSFGINKAANIVLFGSVIFFMLAITICAIILTMSII